MQNIAEKYSMQKLPQKNLRKNKRKTSQSPYTEY